MYTHKIKQLISGAVNPYRYQETSKWTLKYQTPKETYILAYAKTFNNVFVILKTSLNSLRYIKLYSGHAHIKHKL